MLEDRHGSMFIEIFEKSYIPLILDCNTARILSLYALIRAIKPRLAIPQSRDDLAFCYRLYLA
jgi:hypothetical protein